ncbi:unnamed protein product [Tenebrio molitor]|nr:unnamed protein product [Tenebrio molitor]
MDVLPRSPAAHKKEKRGKNKPTARYLIDQYGEKGKAKKKPRVIRGNIFPELLQH